MTTAPNEICCHHRWIALVALTGCMVIGASSAATTPTDRVRASITDILSVLKNENLDRSAKWSEVGRLIDAAFDFRSMSQSILATNWRTATEEEKRQFVEYFSQYLEATYRDKIEAYSDQRVEYLNEVVRGDRAVVDTIIRTSETQIPVSYKLRLNDDEWFAYDVVIEGVSLVNNYRSTFNAIIKSEGMDGLLTDLQGRIDRYKIKHGGLPAP
ncbi:MAG: ABC transporter substrate-binding protein [Proteobacteria bacterium]|nr:MAG: ABC transporter substrate-binding protein [Pseudomonadota bacterium]